IKVMPPTRSTSCGYMRAKSAILVREPVGTMTTEPGSFSEMIWAMRLTACVSSSQKCSQWTEEEANTKRSEFLSMGIRSAPSGLIVQVEEFLQHVSYIQNVRSRNIT